MGDTVSCLLFPLSLPSYSSCFLAYVLFFAFAYSFLLMSLSLPVPFSLPSSLVFHFFATVIFIIGRLILEMTCDFLFLFFCGCCLFFSSGFLWIFF